MGARKKVHKKIKPNSHPFVPASELAILQAIDSFGPNYGLIIAERAQVSSQGVYTLLKRLTEAGHLTPVPDEGPKEHPGMPRTIYEVSVTGSILLQAANEIRMHRYRRNT